VLRVLVVSLAIVAAQLLIAFVVGTLLRRASEFAAVVDANSRARVLKMSAPRAPRRISGPRRAVG